MDPLSKIISPEPGCYYFNLPEAQFCPLFYLLKHAKVTKVVFWCKWRKNLLSRIFFTSKVLKNDCFFLLSASNICVLFQLAEALIFPSKGSANISKYIFILKMTGQVSKFHTHQWQQRSPFNNSHETFNFGHSTFSHLSRRYLAAQQEESSLGRRGLGTPRVLGCLWKRLRNFFVPKGFGV